MDYPVIGSHDGQQLTTNIIVHGIGLHQSAAVISQAHNLSAIHVHTMEQKVECGGLGSGVEGGMCFTLHKKKSAYEMFNWWGPITLQSAWPIFQNWINLVKLHSKLLGGVGMLSMPWNLQLVFHSRGTVLVSTQAVRSDVYHWSTSYRGEQSLEPTWTTLWIHTLHDE